VAVVELELPHHRYAITIEPGSLADLGPAVRALGRGTRCAVVIDSGVLEPHGRIAERSLREAGFEPVVSVLPAGEGSKTLARVETLYRAWIAAGLERGSVVVALGGGVTGDTAGFAAATYLRGVPFVQCPTTLLAMVDSSVGGKVGVNLPEGKNLVGAFYQPHAVRIDPELLRTLPAREIAAGLAECIKHAVIRDPDLFEWTEKNMASIRRLEPAVLVELIRRNVEIKAGVVREDERESGVRAHLNFGHTFGHAIEATRGYGTLLHGEAVGLGMLAAAELARRIEICDADVRARLETLVEAAGLPIRTSLPDDAALRAAMAVDKKVSDARIRFVLPRRLGEVELRSDVSDADIGGAWSSIR